MYPIKTYLDMADETYSARRKLPLENRRRWGRVIVRDSNTAGKDYLLLRVSQQVTDDQPEVGGIRMHKGQVKRLIKALQKFVNEVEENEAVGEGKEDGKQ